MWVVSFKPLVSPPIKLSAAHLSLQFSRSNLPRQLSNTTIPKSNSFSSLSTPPLNSPHFSPTRILCLGTTTCPANSGERPQSHPDFTQPHPITPEFSSSVAPKCILSYTRSSRPAQRPPHSECSIIVQLLKYLNFMKMSYFKFLKFPVHKQESLIQKTLKRKWFNTSFSGVIFTTTPVSSIQDNHLTAHATGEPGVVDITVVTKDITVRENVSGIHVR